MESNIRNVRPGITMKLITFVFFCICVVQSAYSQLEYRIPIDAARVILEEYAMSLGRVSLIITKTDAFVSFNDSTINITSGDTSVSPISQGMLDSLTVAINDLFVNKTNKIKVKRRRRQMANIEVDYRVFYDLYVYKGKETTYHNLHGFVDDWRYITSKEFNEFYDLLREFFTKLEDYFKSLPDPKTNQEPTTNIGERGLKFAIVSGND